jgi:hypothetical protein
MKKESTVISTAERAENLQERQSRKGMGSAVKVHVHGVKEVDVCDSRSRSFHMYGVCVFLIFVGGPFSLGVGLVHSASFLHYRVVILQ